MNDEIKNRIRSIATSDHLEDGVKTERLCALFDEQLTQQNKQMREALQRWQDITNETTGLYGWHLNGDPSPWDEWDEIINMTNEALGGE